MNKLNEEWLLQNIPYKHKQILHQLRIVFASKRLVYLMNYSSYYI
jgi:hypothetical protein